VHAISFATFTKSVIVFTSIIFFNGFQDKEEKKILPLW
jgi:hypothetical protein